MGISYNTPLIADTRLCIDTPPEMILRFHFTAGLCKYDCTHSQEHYKEKSDFQVNEEFVAVKLIPPETMRIELHHTNN